jgi:hypothetical protein
VVAILTYTFRQDKMLERYPLSIDRFAGDNIIRPCQIRLVSVHNFITRVLVPHEFHDDETPLTYDETFSFISS